MSGFKKTFAGNPPKHFAAHSHHPWPDVSFAAQQDAWTDAARLLDKKWDHVFGEIIPKAQKHIARQLALPDPTSITFGPNTHSFVGRILSCLPTGRPPRILTTGSEFMSFSRQLARLEEDGLVSVTRINTEPFDSFSQRFAEAAAEGGHDLVFFSQAFFDSGFRIIDFEKLVNAVPGKDTLIVVDGYHAFMAAPTVFSAVASRAFYLAGGYKFGMSGEGVCFLHCPPGYGPRPRDTGWYASFSALGAAPGTVGYGDDGSRFMGATFDVSGLYRFNAVQDWLAETGQNVASMLAYGRKMERAFLTELEKHPGRITADQLIVPDEKCRARFLAFRTDDSEAIANGLGQRGIIVDYRNDRFRIGLGIYHTEDDVRALARELTV